MLMIHSAYYKPKAVLVVLQDFVVAVQTAEWRSGCDNQHLGVARSKSLGPHSVSKDKACGKLEEHTRFE